jgi:hypothetical protein
MGSAEGTKIGGVIAVFIKPSFVRPGQTESRMAFLIEPVSKLRVKIEGLNNEVPLSKGGFRGIFKHLR